jgi:hypothetical protein
VEVEVELGGCDELAVDDEPQPPRMPMSVRSDTRMSEERKHAWGGKRCVAMRESPCIID